MTRLFLEIKNITLCAEPSFFILLYFLCKNLLFLCAEHNYPFLIGDHCDLLTDHWCSLARVFALGFGLELIRISATASVDELLALLSSRIVIEHFKVGVAGA